MRTARRWYVYGMSYAALIALSAGVTNLASTLIAAAFGLGFDREDVATWAGVLVVAFPLFAGHALWANRLAAQDAEERGAVLRKLFIYATLGLGTLLVALFARKTLAEVLQPLLGIRVPDRWAWLAGLLNDVVAALWGGVILWYGWLLVRRDGDLGREVGLAATWRRLLVVGMGTAGILLFVVGAVRLLQTALLIVIPPVPGPELALGAWWRSGMASNLSTVLVTLALWRLAWAVEAHWAERFPSERTTLSRQAFYYVGVALGLGTLLVALAYLLRQGVLGLLGEPFGPRHTWWPQMAAALSALPLGAWVWYVYRRRMLTEISQKGRPLFHLAVGRLYTYVVSGVALAVFWWGMVTLVRVMTRALVTPPAFSLSVNWWREPLATGLALALVGGPTWAWHWGQVERVARRDTPEGERERVSRVRRVYVYGINLVAGLMVLVYLAQVARELWLWLLGVPRAELLDRLVNALGPAFVSLIVWGYHGLVLRRDMADRREDVDRRAALLAERERLLRRLAEIDEILQTMEQQEEV